MGEKVKDKIKVEDFEKTEDATEKEKYGDAIIKILNEW